MMAIAAIVLAGIVALAMRLNRASSELAWLAGAAVVPAFVLLAEFVPPYQGGGASMWPVALVFGWHLRRSVELDWRTTGSADR